MTAKTSELLEGEKMDQLDHKLHSASPRTSGGDPGVADAVHSLVASTARSAHDASPSGARRRVTTAVITAGLAIGGAGVAAAAPSLLEWFEGRTPDREVRITSGAGTPCDSAHRVVPDRVADDHPSVVGARASLASLDIGTLDLQSVEETMTERGLLDATLTPDQREAEVLSHAIFTAVWDDVEAQGLQSEVIFFEGGTDCTSGAR